MGKQLIQVIQKTAREAVITKQGIRTRSRAKKPLKELAKFLQLNEEQAILFSIVFVMSIDNRSVDVHMIASHMETESIIVMEHLEIFDTLEKSRYIQRSSRFKRDFYKGSIILDDFIVTNRMIEAVFKEQPGLDPLRKKHNLFTFLDTINELIENREEEEHSTEDLYQDIQTLLSSNPELHIVSKLKHFRLSEADLTFLLYMSSEAIDDVEEIDLVRTCELIFDTKQEKFNFRQGILKNNSKLIKLNLTKVQDGNYKHDKELLLTDYAKGLLLPEIDQALSARKIPKSQINPSDIKEEKLFYNKEISEEIDHLKEILHPNNLKQLREGLRKRNLSTGICMLLAGAPGTGKTATSYMLAKSTGRPILPVDISKTRSMWYGESEKIVKSIFLDYNKILKQAETEPILLINECDALLSKRSSNTSSNVSQTHNTIQNILLEEMEQFKGIMICTTNLDSNLDKAFERRFLYQLFFDLPDQATRSRIWLNFFPQLSQEEAKMLAEKRTNISGGLINNLCRKVTMEEVLYGKEVTFERIYKLCEGETVKGENFSPIGFTRSVAIGKK